MRRQSLKESQREALENALTDLEKKRMTPPGAPKLAALKEDIRRAIKKPQTGKRKRNDGLNRRSK